MTNATVRADARALPETTNRRTLLRSILAAGAVATVSAAGASASPVQSEALRIAIAAHKAAQAKVDEMVAPPDRETFDEEAYEDAFAAACDVAEAALWEVAEAPYSSDADFFAKIFYLFKDEQRELGDSFTHYVTFGKLAFAIEMHREQAEA
jgi:hypothetical protein